MPAKPNTRDEKGRFLPGVSGNALGPARKIFSLAAEARVYAQEALETLVDCMRNGEPPIKIKAAGTLLDRGFGTAPQTIKLEGDGTQLPQINVFLAMKDVEEDPLAQELLEKVNGKPRVIEHDGRGQSKDSNMQCNGRAKKKVEASS